jgi:hypothetical protein
MNRNRLYGFILVACFLGTLYFFYHLFYANSQTPGVCIIKNATGYACPSCGTTRAVVLLSKGEVLASLNQNPFGVLVGFCMLILPFWLGYDLIKKKATFYHFYIKSESVIRMPKVAMILILLVVLNWIWNLYKHI